MSNDTSEILTPNRHISYSDLYIITTTKQNMGLIEKPKNLRRCVYVMNVSIILRIIFVTIQISYFSQNRHRFIRFLQQTDESLNHIFNLDISPIYSRDVLNSYLHDTFKNYLKLTDISLLDLKLPPEPILSACYETNLIQNKFCSKIKTPIEMDTFVQSIFDKLDSLRVINIDMEILIAFMNRDRQASNPPKCFSNHYIVKLQNSADGQSFTLSALSQYTQLDCPKNVSMMNEHLSNRKIFNIVSLILFSLSGVFSIYSIYKDTKNMMDNNRIFEKYINQKLYFIEMLWFYHLWNIFDLLTNISIVMGTIINMAINNYTRFNSDLSSVLLGIGVILTWILFIRLLDTNAQYHILLSTLRRATPDVARYLTCVSIIFMGFMLCGWVILGPYHPKFSTSEKTAQTLFSTLNGDDIYLTFEQLSTSNLAVYIIGQIYIYSSVFFFMYVALSMLISIFTLSYSNEPLNNNSPDSLTKKINILDNYIKNTDSSNQVC